MGRNQPNLRVSGAEGTGRDQGTGSSHERRYARRFTAGRGGSGLISPQAAVNFGCPASCGGTHPSEFRHKNDAPCFRAGQARGSSCKLSGFDFTSAPVYCHVCFWRPAPQCAAWCCMPNVGIQHQVAPKNGTPALQCTNWGQTPTFLPKPYHWVASHTPS